MSSREYSSLSVACLAVSLLHAGKGYAIGLFFRRVGSDIIDSHFYISYGINSLSCIVHRYDFGIFGKHRSNRICKANMVTPMCYFYDLPCIIYDSKCRTHRIYLLGLFKFIRKLYRTRRDIYYKCFCFFQYSHWIQSHLPEFEKLSKSSVWVFLFETFIVL